MTLTQRRVASRMPLFFGFLGIKAGGQRHGGSLEIRRANGFRDSLVTSPLGERDIAQE